MLSIYYGAVGVAISSLTSRRIVAGVAILGLALVPSAITGVLLNNNNDGTSAVAVLNLLALPLYLRDLIFLGQRRSGQPARRGRRSAVGLAVVTYLVVLVAAFAILLIRYRQPDA